TNALSDENCKSVIVAPKNDKIEFDYIFENEQEYFIRIYMYTENPQWVCQLNVYCVDDDLYGKYPLKGDTHIHSNMSDGRETPQTIAAHYRKAGFDYIALTDHGLWEPSDKMIKFYNEIPVDLKMFHGEEIHPPDNKIHIVNFGGDFSINDIFKKNPQLYHDQTKEIFNQLKVKNISENINLTELASCIWVTEKIKQAKGISVFCHPLWLVNGYHVNQEMTEYLLNNNIFDAFEVCGGV
ncbi:MAG: PHP domain-containing protein, partial [Oscillospiraceae bacterium]